MVLLLPASLEQNVHEDLVIVLDGGFKTSGWTSKLCTNVCSPEEQFIVTITGQPSCCIHYPGLSFFRWPFKMLTDVHPLLEQRRMENETSGF
jgi:hypothetical protein